MTDPSPRIAALEADMKAMQAALFDLLAASQEQGAMVEIMRRQMLEKAVADAGQKVNVGDGFPFQDNENAAKIERPERALQRSNPGLIATLPAKGPAS